MTSSGLLVPDDGHVHYRETSTGHKVIDSPLIVGPDEHTFIPGRNGTGKSWTARKIHSREPYIVVHDTKGDWKWPEVPKHEIAWVTKLAELRHVRKRKIVYTPVKDELEWEAYEIFYDWVYERQNCRVIVDELMQVCPSPMKVPSGLKGCWTRGRSRRTSVAACTQRPMTIPNLAISEAMFFYILDLNLPQDRAKIVEVSGVPDFYKRPGNRSLWFYKMGEDRAVKLKLVA
jgi:hypothetical protein